MEAVEVSQTLEYRGGQLNAAPVLKVENFTNSSDLHLGEWREVFKAYPNKKGKGWMSIYKQIQERIYYLRTTEAELGIDLDRPLSLNAVLEEGPWMIRNSPIILKKWSVNTCLKNEDMSRIPIWVKLHEVPIQAFEEDGISLIASYLGKLIMLDSYTTTMCKESWGRSSFARCLIEINAEAKFVESITIGIPELEGTNFIKETIRVEYEWKPLRLVNKKCNNKKNAAGIPIPKGVPVAKGFQVGKQFNYQPKSPNSDSSGGGNRGATSSKASSSANELDDEDEVVKNIYDESANLNLKETSRASTSAQTVNMRIDNKTLFYSFVYADNYYIDHRVLRNNLVRHAGLMQNRPWVLLGDFNAALNIEDHSSSSYEPNAAIHDFKECV
ncbi:zinc knuckle CX2CX4HX4C containing protein [Tanacetum coccineum]|uniref:Zinc knuckle CX2CX4HX4C containing protein n=1 Tax=Tanacetum coccineum TaxID=301880 RepID=A0ABQ5EUE6_9ASTR